MSIGFAAAATAMDMLAFQSMTSYLRATNPAIYERFFSGGTWALYFDETSSSIWRFYLSTDGSGDPTLRRLKVMSKMLSWIAPLSWFGVALAVCITR